MVVAEQQPGAPRGEYALEGDDMLEDVVAQQQQLSTADEKRLAMQQQTTLRTQEFFLGRENDAFVHPGSEELQTQEFFDGFQLASDGVTQEPFERNVQLWPEGIAYAAQERKKCLPPAPPDPSWMRVIRKNIRKRAAWLILSFFIAQVFLFCFLFPFARKGYALYVSFETTAGLIPLVAAYSWFFYLLLTIQLIDYTDYDLHLMGYDVTSIEGRATLRAYRDPKRFAPPKFVPFVRPEPVRSVSSVFRSFDRVFDNYQFRPAPPPGEEPPVSSEYVMPSGYIPSYHYPWSREEHELKKQQRRQERLARNEKTGEALVDADGNALAQEDDGRMASVIPTGKPLVVSADLSPTGRTAIVDPDSRGTAPRSLLSEQGAGAPAANDRASAAERSAVSGSSRRSSAGNDFYSAMAGAAALDGDIAEQQGQTPACAGCCRPPSPPKSYNERPMLVGKAIRGSAAQMVALGSQTSDGGTVLAYRGAPISREGRAAPGSGTSASPVGEQQQTRGHVGALSTVAGPQSGTTTSTNSTITKTQEDELLIEYPAAKEGFIIIGGKYDLLARDRCCIIRNGCPICTIWDAIGWAMPKTCLFLTTGWWGFLILFSLLWALIWYASITGVRHSSLVELQQAETVHAQTYLLNNEILSDRGLVVSKRRMPRKYIVYADDPELNLSVHNPGSMGPENSFVQTSFSREAEAADLVEPSHQLSTTSADLQPQETTEPGAAVWTSASTWAASFTQQQQEHGQTKIATRESASASPLAPGWIAQYSDSAASPRYQALTAAWLQWVHQHMNWVPRKIWVYVEHLPPNPLQVASIRKLQYLHPEDEGWKVNVLDPTRLPALLDPSEYSVWRAPSTPAGSVPAAVAKQRAPRVKERVRFAVVERYGGIFVDLEAIWRQDFSMVVPNLAPANLESLSMTVAGNTAENLPATLSRGGLVSSQLFLQEDLGGAAGATNATTEPLLPAQASGKSLCTVFTEPGDTRIEFRAPASVKRHPLSWFQACPPQNLFAALVSHELEAAYVNRTLTEEDTGYVANRLQLEGVPTPGSRCSFRTKYHFAATAVQFSFSMRQSFDQELFQMRAWRENPYDERGVHTKLAATGQTTWWYNLWMFLLPAFRLVATFPDALAYVQGDRFFFPQEVDMSAGPRGVLRARVDADKFINTMDSDGFARTDLLNYLRDDHPIERWAKVALEKRIEANDEEDPARQEDLRKDAKKLSRRSSFPVANFNYDTWAVRQQDHWLRPRIYLQPR
ncbi:unnamed protein product [Amoebophrya sp. A120]|nr:unnamed protein product [Amoebophrya sp. A120]|eukprot:GSA120T00022797001.1